MEKRKEILMKIHFVLSRKYLIKVFGAIAGLIALWLLRSKINEFMTWVVDRQAVINTIKHLGGWGPLLIFAVMLLQVFLAMIPGHALVLAAGYVYGFAICLLVTVGSTVLGSQIAFTISRRYGRRLIYRLASPQAIDRWDRLAANQGGMFYFFVFVLPIFPSDLMCYVAGLGKVSPRRFFLANCTGRLVASSFVALVGSQGLHMPVLFWMAAILAMAAFYVAWIFYSRKYRIGSPVTLNGVKNENRDLISILPADDQRSCALR
jgi:uncharacterized membrane protein YdjX (TVP38/TMEM64 family)